MGVTLGKRYRLRNTGRAIPSQFTTSPFHSLCLALSLPTPPGSLSLSGFEASTPLPTQPHPILSLFFLLSISFLRFSSNQSSAGGVSGECHLSFLRCWCIIRCFVVSGRVCALSDSET
ncbi:unnamed protein product, partial [Vitis vinifera]